MNKIAKKLLRAVLCGLLTGGLFLGAVGEGASVKGTEPKIRQLERSVVTDSAKKAVKLARPSKNGALRVKGTNLVDKKGRIVQLRGISTHGLAWFPQYVNQKCFKNLKKWGANVVRLAMYTGEYGGYCSGGDQKALEKLIKDGVKYAKKADMYVIVDWHILSDGDPNTYKKEAKGFFKRITKALSKYKNVLYEICNEPNGGTTWDQIKSYAKPVIKTIRKKAKKAVIIVGTPNWSQFVDQAAESPLSGKNIMYALHFYSGTHREDLQNTMKAARAEGLPIFVTEFGLCDASGNGGLDLDSGKKWLKLLDEDHISYVNWSLCNKAETASILKPEVSKTHGFKKADLSEGGRWYLNWLKKKKS